MQSNVKSPDRIHSHYIADSLSIMKGSVGHYFGIIIPRHIAKPIVFQYTLIQQPIYNSKDYTSLRYVNRHTTPQ
jgi:hypothetical protein